MFLKCIRPFVTGRFKEEKLPVHKSTCDKVPCITQAMRYRFADPSLQECGLWHTRTEVEIVVRFVCGGLAHLPCGSLFPLGDPVWGVGV